MAEPKFVTILLLNYEGTVLLPLTLPLRKRIIWETFAYTMQRPSSLEGALMLREMEGRRIEEDLQRKVDGLRCDGDEWTLGKLERTG